MTSGATIGLLVKTGGIIGLVIAMQHPERLRRLFA
jgi:hypothetical protein